MAAAAERSAAPARKSDRVGVVAIVHDQVTLDRIQGVIRELQLDDELRFVATLDVALRNIHDGQHPRVLVIDLTDSPAPIADLSAARAVGGADMKVVALGSVNDVGLYRDLIAAGASDYLVKPSSVALSAPTDGFILPHDAQPLATSDTYRQTLPGPSKGPVPAGGIGLIGPVSFKLD